MQFLFLFSIASAELFDILSDEPIDTSFVQKFKPRTDLDPVILLPGLGGSRVEYKNSTGTAWKTLWLDSTRALPGRYTEWIRELTVSYNPTTQKYSSASGIETRPVDYSGLDGVTCLDPTVCAASGYYSTLIKALNETGYIKGKNLFGAPFDWRLANVKQILTNGMCNNLKILVESASAKNLGKKVHLVGHSCGSAFIHQFLTRYVTSEWRSKYIASFISASGPFGGSFEAFAHMASPHKWGMLPVPASVIHPVAEELAAIHWMLPNLNGYSSDRVVATIPAINQTICIGNLSTAFSMTGRTVMESAVKMTMENVNHMEAPRVPVHLFISTGIDTTDQLQYDGTKDDWYTKEAKVIKGDGDGTVPIDSLRAPLRWQKEQPEPVTFQEFPKVKHGSIIHNEGFVSAVLDIVSRN